LPALCEAARDAVMPLLSGARDSETALKRQALEGAKMAEQFRCEPCSVEFASQEDLDKHNEEHHSE
jgi:hypothetical protein